MQTAHQIPRLAIRSIAGGLLLMALFTMIWAGIASSGLQGVEQFIELALFSLLSILFLLFGMRLFITSKNFPALTNMEDKEEAKRMGIRYGIIFGLEGITIPIACGILVYLKHTNYIIPVIALIVGVHFYPMAKIFRRTIDYWLATWTTLSALGSILSIHYHWLDISTAFAFLGICVAIATSCYGFYIAHEGQRLIAGNKTDL